MLQRTTGSNQSLVAAIRTEAYWYVLAVRAHISCLFFLSFLVDLFQVTISLKLV